MSEATMITMGTCPNCGHSPTQFVAAEFNDSGEDESWHWDKDFTYKRRACQPNDDEATGEMIVDRDAHIDWRRDGSR